MYVLDSNWQRRKLKFESCKPSSIAVFSDQTVVEKVNIFKVASGSFFCGTRFSLSPLDLFFRGLLAKSCYNMTTFFWDCVYLNKVKFLPFIAGKDKT